MIADLWWDVMGDNNKSALHIEQKLRLGGKRLGYIYVIIEQQRRQRQWRQCTSIDLLVDKKRQ